MPLHLSELPIPNSGGLLFNVIVNFRATPVRPGNTAAPTLPGVGAVAFVPVRTTNSKLRLCIVNLHTLNTR